MGPMLHPKLGLPAKPVKTLLLRCCVGFSVDTDIAAGAWKPLAWPSSTLRQSSSWGSFSFSQVLGCYFLSKMPSTARKIGLSGFWPWGSQKMLKSSFRQGPSKKCDSRGRASWLFHGYVLFLCFCSLRFPVFKRPLILIILLHFTVNVCHLFIFFGFSFWNESSPPCFLFSSDPSLVSFSYWCLLIVLFSFFWFVSSTCSGCGVSYFFLFSIVMISSFWSPTPAARTWTKKKQLSDFICPLASFKHCPSKVLVYVSVVDLFCPRILVQFSWNVFQGGVFLVVCYLLLSFLFVWATFIWSWFLLFMGSFGCCFLVVLSFSRSSPAVPLILLCHCSWHLSCYSFP